MIFSIQTEFIRIFHRTEKARIVSGCGILFMFTLYKVNMSIDLQIDDYCAINRVGISYVDYD